MGIKILVADNHVMFREGLCTLLRREDGLEVVAEAEDGVDATERSMAVLPDVAVLNIHAKDSKCLDHISELRKKAPSIAIIALCTENSGCGVPEVLKLGVKSLVMKEWPFQELVTAIRQAYNNGSYLSPRLSNILISSLTDGEKPSEKQLTVRENETYRRLVAGKNCKEIAYELDISTKTVETYRAKVMKKFGVTNVAQLVNCAIKEGVIR